MCWWTQKIIIIIIISTTTIYKWNFNRLTRVVLKPDMVLSTCTESSSTWQQFYRCTVSSSQLLTLHATRQHTLYHTHSNKQICALYFTHINNKCPQTSICHVLSQQSISPYLRGSSVVRWYQLNSVWPKEHNQWNTDLHLTGLWLSINSTYNTNRLNLEYNELIF